MTKKVTITKQEMADGTRWNAQVWAKTSEGFVYCGIGRFCKSLEEAESYKQTVMKEG